MSNKPRPRSRKPAQPWLSPPLVLPGFTPLVESTDDGSLLTALPEQSLCLPWEECLRHTLTIGKTGSGKTLRFMLRSIFAAIRNPEMSLVVIDAQRSEEERIIRYAQHIRGADTQIIRLNWLDPVFSTHYWNCLDAVRTRADAYDLASSLATSLGHTGSGDSLYFRQQAIQLLSAIFRALAKEGRANLGETRRLLDAGATEMRELAERTNVAELRRFATELDMGNRNTETSIAEASNHLIALCDERVVQTTSVSELQFQMLADKPTVLILSLDEEAVERLRPLTNSFLHRLFSWIISAGRNAGGPLPRPLGIFIDEFASAVGKLPDFERRAHTLRKRNAAIFAAVQSTEQITAEYREAAPSVMAAFNHRILIPPVAESDAAAASSLTGIIQTDNVTVNSTGSALSISPLHRPLLLPQEIATPERDPDLGPRMTFLFADTPPFQGWLRAAYELPDEKVWLENTGVLPFSPHPPTEDPPEDYFSPVATGPGTIPPGLTNTAGWTPEATAKHLEKVKEHLDWDNTTGSARKWWEAFENENRQRLNLVVRLAEELKIRSATIAEFFLSYVYSNTDNIQANLHYLDYSRLKKSEEKEAQMASLNPEESAKPAKSKKPTKPKKSAKRKPPALPRKDEVPDRLTQDEIDDIFD